ncbi:MAG: thiamine-phosphate kinase [Pseudomonadota bacterium]|nr:thiamine-phosphate kinase [Pseudomonadota bacterium]
MKVIAKEFNLIQRFFAREASNKDIVLSIGDDAAITKVPTNYELVTTTDSLVAGTHFLSDSDPCSIGHRSLAVNLSDLAAMGANPRWASIALHLPEINEAWLADFAKGFFKLANRFDVDLIGGDTVKGPLAITVTLQGLVPEGSAVKRSGGSSGDIICVTGHPGLAAFARKHNHSDLVACYDYPEPQLVIGEQVRAIVSAMIDISDGLDSDLRQLLLASNLGASIDVESLPIEARVKDSVGFLDAVELALFGGEDYELLFSVPPSKLNDLLEMSNNWDKSLSLIGQFNEGKELNWLLDSKPFNSNQSGFKHFI